MPPIHYKQHTLLHAVANNALTPAEDIKNIRDIKERKAALYLLMHRLLINVHIFGTLYIQTKMIL